MEEEINLQEYWQVIRKRLPLVIAAPIIAAILCATMVFFFSAPAYQATTALLVNQKSSSDPSAQYQAILASQAMVNTYTDIIKSRSVERAVVKELKLPDSAGQLDQMISVNSPNQSEVIDVTVTAGSQPLAASIANAVATEFQKRAQTLMNIQDVQIVDPAVANPSASPIKPHKKKDLAVSVVLGLLVGVALAFALEFLKSQFHTEDEIRRHLNLPVLGIIADYSPDGDLK